MSGASRLKPAPDPFVPEFGERGELRQKVGASGRAHIDRWLHFLVAHRSADPDDSLARRVALNSPAYLVWHPDDDHAAASALDAITAAMRERFGQILIVTLEDRPTETPDEHAPTLAPFTATVGASDGERARRAAAALEKGLGAAEIDLRRCSVEIVPLPDVALIDSMLGDDPKVERLALEVPQIHLRPDGGAFPQLTHDLATACGDAVLRAACAFLADGKGAAPVHYRSLGRSAFLAAAKSADRKLDQVGRSFDFLLSISPINTSEAADRFLAAGEDCHPEFRYRPLTVDPDEAKRDLYEIDLSRLEDPLLEGLLGEKRREVDNQLTMLATRHTPAFRAASMLLYGSVDEPLLADAHSVLATARKGPRVRDMLGADEVAAAAEALIATYRDVDLRFAATVEVRADVTGLMVTGGNLCVAADSAIPRHRIDALLAHEVSVHLLTWCNGANQGLGMFRTGLAHYEGIQEGLGVFAEWAVGGLSPARLRLLAGRVVAVHAMLGGATFIEVYRLLNRDHGFSKRRAFGIAARVYRSGGLAKDLIYLQGFRAVVDLVAAGASLDPFWLGKIAPDHVPAIEELLQRGLIREPLFLPEFLSRPDTRGRIARLRKGLEFQAMFEPE